MAGLLVFAAGSATSAFSDTPDRLIAARAFMGIGAAAIMPSTLSILTNVFTEAESRARAIGFWSGTTGLDVAIGPVAGGWLLSHYWWGSVFLVEVPIALGGLLGRHMDRAQLQEPGEQTTRPRGGCAVHPRPGPASVGAGVDLEPDHRLSGLAQLARASFVSGMGLAGTVGAVVVGAAALGVLVFLPNRAAPAPPEEGPVGNEVPVDADPHGVDI